jgi:cell wall-associated NlpC family hydrolase
MYSPEFKDFLKKAMTIPYLHKGRDYSGADCGGFIMLLYRDFLGITLPDFNIDYDVNWAVKADKSHFIENYYKLFQKVEKPELYDIVLFQTKKGIANHGGVVIGNSRFIHLFKSGMSINSYNDETFKRRLNGFYHYKG